MSLETLIEAARFVEQQERRAKLQNIQTPVSLASTPPDVIPNSFKIISTSPTQQLSINSTISAGTVHQIKPQVTHGHVNISGGRPVEIVLKDEREVPDTLKITAAGQQVVEIVTKPLPILNGFDKPTIILPTTNQSEAPKHFTLSPSSASAAIIPTPTSKRHVAQNVQTILNATTNGPSVMRSGTREVHNKLEKNRRAHLKECFEILKKQLPPQQDEKKSSNLSILHSAIRYIQVLKKRERENEHEMERLAREKIAAQQRLAALKKELGPQWDNVDFNCLISENGGVVSQTLSTSSTPPTLVIKDEPLSPNSRPVTSSLPTTQLSVLPLHTTSVGGAGYHQVGQSLAVVGLHKLALLGNGKSVQMVQSPVAHIITAPQQLNGKVVPLVNAQYLMKPVVVVSTPSAGTTRQS